MEFHQLESFIKVVELRSFTKAAEELFLTQPAITNNVQNLEKELNAILLNRKSKNITVTEAGKILYQYALNIVNMRDTAAYSINQFMNNIEDNIEINTCLLPDKYLLPELIREFLMQYPNITFNIKHRNSDCLFEDILGSGSVNFGIVNTKLVCDFLEFIDFYEDELIILTPNNDAYPWSSYEKMDMKFLLNHKIIMQEEGSEVCALVKKCLAKHGIGFDSLDIVASTDNHETIIKMVELGLGIAFMPKHAVINELNVHKIKPLLLKEASLKIHFYFVYYKKRVLSPMTEQFKNFIKKGFNKRKENALCH